MTIVIWWQLFANIAKKKTLKLIPLQRRGLEQIKWDFNPCTRLNLKILKLYLGISQPIWFDYYQSPCKGFPGGTSGKELACQCNRRKRLRFNPWAGKIRWRRECILAWRIPWTEEPGRLQSRRSQIAKHDWSACIPIADSWTWLKVCMHTYLCVTNYLKMSCLTTAILS